jgi:hypothetical protein
MRLRVLVVATGFLWPLSAFSHEDVSQAFESGNELYQQCTAASGSPQNVFCGGYVTAVSDSLESQRLVCTPKGTTAGQIKDVIVNYLRDHPAETHHTTAYSLAELALMAAFPCLR